MSDAVRWIVYDPPGDTPPLATGYPGNLYRPDWDITRAQVTRMLYRLNT